MAQKIMHTNVRPVTHAGPDRPTSARRQKIEAAKAERQRLWLERTLELSTLLLAEFGTHTCTLPNLAIGMRVRTCELRAHFGDLDGLLAHILHLHLDSLTAVLAAIGPATPDRAARLTEAYLAHTRNADGSLNDPHKLLIRDRHLLPETCLAGIEQARAVICGMLGEWTVMVLDNPVFDARRSIMFPDLFPPAATLAAACSAAEPRDQETLAGMGGGATAAARKDGEWLH